MPAVCRTPSTKGLRSTNVKAPTIFNDKGASFAGFNLIGGRVQLEAVCQFYVAHPDNRGGLPSLHWPSIKNLKSVCLFFDNSPLQFSNPDTHHKPTFKYVFITTSPSIINHPQSTFKHLFITHPHSLSHTCPSVKCTSPSTHHTSFTHTCPARHLHLNLQNVWFLKLPFPSALWP